MQLKGKSFVLYGLESGLEDELRDAIVARGGSVQSEIQDETSFLVTTPSQAKQIQSEIIQQAIEKGIHVITDQFLRNQLSNSSDTSSIDSSLPSLDRDGSLLAEKVDLLHLRARPLPTDISNNQLPSRKEDEEEGFSSDENELDYESDYEDTTSSSAFKMFPLVPQTVTGTASEQRMEWQRLLNVYLTGGEVERERLRRESLEITSDDSSKARQSYVLWMSINAKLRGIDCSPDEFEKYLEMERNESLGLLMDYAMEFVSFVSDSDSFDAKVHHQLTISEATDRINMILDQFDKCRLLFVTEKEFAMYSEKQGIDFTRLSASVITPILSWRTKRNLAMDLDSRIRIWLNLPKGNGSDFVYTIDKDSIPKLVKSFSNNSIFSERIFKDIDRFCQKYSAASNQHFEKWKSLRMPSLEGAIRAICNFPLSLTELYLEHCIESTSTFLQHNEKINSNQIRPNISNMDVSSSISNQWISIAQFLSDFRASINNALLQKQKNCDYFESTNIQIDKKSTYELIDKLLAQSLKSYLQLLQIKFQIGRHGYWFRNQHLLETEWTYLKSIANHICGGDLMISECISYLVDNSIQSVTYWVKTQMKPPLVSTASTETSVKLFSRLLEHLRMRSRKLVQFLKLFLNEVEHCSEFQFHDDVTPETLMGFVSDNNFRIYQLQHCETFYILCREPVDDEAILEYFAFPFRNEPKNGYILIIPVSCFGDVKVNFKVLTANIESPVLKRSNFTGLLLITRGFHAHDEAYNSLVNLLCDSNPIVVSTSERQATHSELAQRIFKIKRSLVRLVITVSRAIPAVRAYLTAFQASSQEHASMNSPTVDLLENFFSFASSFGAQSVSSLSLSQKVLLLKHLINLSVEWITFTCSDCSPLDKKTFRWALMALEFVMWVTKGSNILALSEEAFVEVRQKVACCMTLLISGLHVSNEGLESEKNQITSEGEELDEEEEDLELIINEVLQRDNMPDSLADSKYDAILNLDKRREEFLQSSGRIGKVLDVSNPTYRQVVDLLTASSSKVSIRWQQGKLIGGGTFGQVFLGINLDSGELLAVKEILFHASSDSRNQHPNNGKQLHQHKAGKTYIGRIQEEMRVLEQLNHVNVVQYYGIEIYKDKCIMFMEFCSNGSLRTLIESAGRIEEEMTVALYTYELLQGLKYLHDNHIIHRDIKPDNILFDNRGVLKLVDFGAAKIFEETTGVIEIISTKGQPTLAGTACYMSPEVVVGKPYLGKFGAQDIWSCGCVVTEMITGKRPWSHLDNDWAILYNIGLSRKHPELPIRSSAFFNNPDPNKTQTKPSLSDMGVDLLNLCFVDADMRPNATELLEHSFFNQLKQRLAEYHDRKGYSSGPYPNPWSNDGGFFNSLNTPSVALAANMARNDSYFPSMNSAAIDTPDCKKNANII